MGIEYVNIEESEFLLTKLIHKFLPIENALNILNNKYFWFANPMQWKDPFEKRFIEGMYEEKSFPWKDRVFCTCFTGTSTSEAFWNTYLNGEIGVQLKIKRGALLQVIKEYAAKHPNYTVFIGKIEYKYTNDITKNLSSIPFEPELSNKNINSQYFRARLLLLKRKAYEFEDEYRIIVVKDKNTKEEGIKVSYTVENDSLIEGITLDPHLKPNMVSFLKNAIKQQYGSQIEVCHSYLYKEFKPVKIRIK